MKKKTIYLILIIFVGILTLIQWNRVSSSNSAKMAVYPVISELPGFDLQQVKGKPFLLHFWAKWCEPCAEEIPHLVEFSKNTQFKTPLLVLAISLDESLEVAKTILPDQGKSLPPNFILALDSQHQIAEKMGTYQYPETYWVSPQGEIIEKWVGAQKWQKPEVLEFFRQKLNQ